MKYEQYKADFSYKPLPNTYFNIKSRVSPLYSIINGHQRAQWTHMICTPKHDSPDTCQYLTFTWFCVCICGPLFP